MTPQAGASMQSGPASSNFRQPDTNRGLPPLVGSGPSPTIQQPGGGTQQSGINPGGKQQRARRDQANDQGLGAQGAAGSFHNHFHAQHNVHAQNQAQYNQYFMHYNQHMDRSMRQQQQQHQQMIDMTVEDLHHTLRSLKREKDHVLARGNPDRLEDFLKRSLRTFHEDLVHARRGGYLSHDQVDHFQGEYNALADVVQDDLFR